MFSPYMTSLSYLLKSGPSLMAILMELFPFKNLNWVQMGSDTAVIFLMDFTNPIRLIESSFLSISLQMVHLKFHLEVLTPIKFLEGLKVFDFWIWVLVKTGRFKFQGFKSDSLGNLKMVVIVHSLLTVQMQSLIHLIHSFFCQKGKVN